MPISVLIADDEPFIAMMVQAMLERDGRFLASTVATGEEALRSCRAAPPRILLLDVMMPGLDGFKVCKLLKADPHTSRTRIIMLTALMQRVDFTEGFESGADDYVTKPFTPKRLIEAIDKVLGTASPGESGRAGAPRFRRGDRIVQEDGRTATVLSRIPPGQWWGEGWGYRVVYDDGGQNTVEDGACRAA